MGPVDLTDARSKLRASLIWYVAAFCFHLSIEFNFLSFQVQIIEDVRYGVISSYTYVFFHKIAAAVFIYH